MRGVAIQINAFNFPVWGPLEKFAPAFLAGVPSLIKPAEPDRVPHRAAGRADRRVGPAAGGHRAVRLRRRRRPPRPRDRPGPGVLHRLGGHRAQLRTHPVVVRESVRFNAEADSLNCSILGPDATPGTPEFDLYVKQLVTEMTVKAGQKCTAIRRAFVPAELIGDVTEAVRERLAKVTVGNPAREGVRMGALAGLEQREEVRRSLKALTDAATWSRRPRARRRRRRRRRARRVPLPDPAALRRPRPRRAARGRGVRPGQSTLMPYTSPEHAVELAARGQGSLAGSVVTADTGFAREVVLGAAPWHGRLLVLDRGRREGVHRARLAAAGTRARRPGTRRWRRGDGRHPRRAAPHAAHRRAGRARRCSPR